VIRVRSLAVGVALVALAGCAKAGDLVANEPTEPSDTLTASQPTTQEPAVAPAPQDGACRMLTLKDIPPPSNDTPTVACDQTHTAVTYFVDQWPRRMVQAATGVEDEELESYVTQRCDAAWRNTVGGSLEDWVVSIVSWAWYRPTPEQFAEGARWFRCDVVAGQNTDRLEDLPQSVNGLFDNKYPDTFHACWTKVFSDQDGVDEGTLTSCARKHQQRAIGIVQLGNGKADQAYPGTDATFNQANELCADKVAKWRGEKQPGQFGLQWPRRDEWNNGERYATCWAVTRD